LNTINDIVYENAKASGQQSGKFGRFPKIISNGEKSMLLFTHEFIENVTECNSFSHGFPFST
jgi:hypothetical protein